MVKENGARLRLARAVILTGSFALAACGGGSNEAPKPAARSEAAKEPAETMQPATAILAGRVLVRGKIPPNTEIKMNADPLCKKQHPKGAYSEGYIVGDSGALANVFVYVKSGLEGPTFPTPKDTVILDQRGCEYYPHVFGMQVNQPLTIINSDPTLHNIHPLPKNSKGFNLGMPKQGMRLTRTFTAPEVMVKIKCDVHSWMNAYAGVLNHPYYAVTGKDGGYRIGPLPPGRYILEAWHEELGTLTQTVTVGANQTAQAIFTFNTGAP